MAHEIDMSNDRVNFAYVAEHGSVWHGLGQIIPLGSDLDLWKREAGLEWTAESSDIIYMNGNGEGSIFPSKRALFRSDTQEPLSIVSADYNIVQPSEIVDFFSDLLGNHDMEMSSCGSLFGGKRFFATAKLNEYQIVPGDVITGYLLIATSLDGTLATTAKTTSVRTVCNNTLTMASREYSANVIKVPHSTAFDADRAKLEIGLIQDVQGVFVENMKKLVSIKISDLDAEKFYQDMFFNPDLARELQHGTTMKKVSDMMTLYKFGNGAEYGQDTLYNVLQGVTDYYSNNLRSRTDSSKFWSSFYGAGEKIKLEAQDKLLALAA
jgi:phage/plasmid-like protein (TIGR03299 family)